MKREQEITQFAKWYRIPRTTAVKLFVSYGRKPTGYRPVLERDSNAKTVLGQAEGYMTGVCYLAASDSSGHEMCPFKSDQCPKLCLTHSGHGQFDHTQEARVRKTLRYVENTTAFIEWARWDVFSLMRHAAKRGYIPAVRMNGTSDQPKLAKGVARAFAMVPRERLPFYDYTKIPGPWKREMANYSLTFSREEDNWNECLKALAHGINVAVVFRDTIPAEYMGYPVLDGTTHDLRFLDPKNHIVGLTAKGKEAKSDTMNGFVILN